MHTDAAQFATILTPEQLDARIQRVVDLALAARASATTNSHYTVTETARELKCSERQVWRLISLKQLKAVKIAGKNQIASADVARYKREAR